MSLFLGYLSGGMAGLCTLIGPWPYIVPLIRLHLTYNAYVMPPTQQIIEMKAYYLLICILHSTAVQGKDICHKDIQ